MADPRARLSEGLKNLGAPPTRQTVPPPPPRPTPEPEPQPDPADTAPAPDDATTEPNGGGEAKPKPKTRRAPRPKPNAESGDDDLIGRPMGNKRSVVVYLPVSVRETLDERTADEGTTKGIIIMRTLRESHAELAKSAAAQAAPDPNSPFPPERPSRTRTDEKKVPTTFTVFPDEAVALAQVARDLTDGNVSALVTDALELRLSRSS